MAVLRGESTMLFGSGPSVVPHANTGELQRLATTGPKRTMPELATIAEVLPVVAPTEERFRRTLCGKTLASDHLVGHVPPATEPAMVRTVAIRELIAGCKPG